MELTGRGLVTRGLLALAAADNPLDRVRGLSLLAGGRDEELRKHPAALHHLEIDRLDSRCPERHEVGVWVGDLFDESKGRQRSLVAGVGEQRDVIAA